MLLKIHWEEILWIGALRSDKKSFGENYPCKAESWIRGWEAGYRKEQASSVPPSQCELFLAIVKTNEGHTLGPGGCIQPADVCVGLTQCLFIVVFYFSPINTKAVRCESINDQKEKNKLESCPEISTINACFLSWIFASWFFHLDLLGRTCCL